MIIGDEAAALLEETFRIHATFPSRAVVGTTVRDSTELTWVDSGHDTDTSNLVVGSRLSQDRVGPAIEEVRPHFASVGRPYSWWVSPGDEPADLSARLASAGLVSEAWELAMACRIGDLPEGPTVPGLTIEQARGTSALADFARINADDWTPPDRLVERYYARAAHALLAAGSPLRFYVARREGEAVAAVEAAVAGAAAGVFNLSTIRRHHGVGIGASILRSSLQTLADESGVVTAVLQAAPAAGGLYRRLGFTEFGRITEFKPVHNV